MLSREVTVQRIIAFPKNAFYPLDIFRVDFFVKQHMYSWIRFMSSPKRSKLLVDINRMPRQLLEVGNKRM